MTKFFDVEVTEEEYKSRKKWLTATLLFQSYGPFLLLLSILLGVTLTPQQKDMALAMMVGSFLSTWILYHCAYRKCGAKWLTFVLFSSPVGVFSTLSQLSNASLFTLFFTGIQVALFVWWYILSLRLRRLNQKIALQLKPPTTPA